MRLNVSNPVYHIFYWFGVAMSLAIIIGISWGSMLESYYYTILLLPVILGTSYFFNYYLIPNFLLKKRYFLFGLYFLYTIIISLYLEIIALVLSFVFLANFRIERMGNSSDILLLAILMYLFVFIGSILLLLKQLTDYHNNTKLLSIENVDTKRYFLELTSNRKVIMLPADQILFIESMGDYIKVHSSSSAETISKEKISNIEKRLPDSFLRIHRSFIINKEKITSFNYEQVSINGTFLNIGKSYKKGVMNMLKP